MLATSMLLKASSATVQRTQGAGPTRHLGLDAKAPNLSTKTKQENKESDQSAPLILYSVLIDLYFLHFF